MKIILPILVLLCAYLGVLCISEIVYSVAGDTLEPAPILCFIVVLAILSLIICCEIKGGKKKL